MTDRLSALRDILRQGSLSTQDDLRRKLEKLHFAVTQSTISRDLRRIGAIRVNDQEGRVVYRLPDPEQASPSADLAKKMVKSIQPAASFVVIQTTPGTASLVALYLDRHKPAGTVGTIAGEDTVLVALSRKSADAATLRELHSSLENLG